MKGASSSWWLFGMKRTLFFVVVGSLLSASCVQRASWPSSHLMSFGRWLQNTHDECMSGSAEACETVGYFLASPVLYDDALELGWGGSGAMRRRDCDLAELYGARACELDSSSKYCVDTPCDAAPGQKLRFGIDKYEIVKAEEVLPSLYGTAAEVDALGCHGYDGAACLRLGTAFQGGDADLSIDREPRFAFAMYLRGCDDAGDADACVAVAIAFRDGIGVPQDLVLSQQYEDTANRMRDDQ